MLNKYLIKIVMLSAPLLRALGVNTLQLRVILQTKCMVDDRRPPGLQMYKNASSKRSSGKAKNVLFLIMGAFLSVILFLGDPLLAHTLYITAFMMYVITSLITDYSNVLIDVRDHYFIVSRPVDDTTVAAGRLLHIFIYLTGMFVPLIFPAVLVAFIKDGILSGLIFLVELASAASVSVFSVNIIYMLMLQFMSPQKFRDLIAYFQIAFSTLLLASYVVFPQFLEGLQIMKISPLDYTIAYILPPVWIASLQHWAMGIFNLTTYLFTAGALVLPIVCLTAVIKFLSGSYNDKLSLMGGPTQSSKAKKVANRKKPLCDKLAPLFTGSPLEQLGFKITWKLSSRMQEFKVRVYPSIAYIPIYFIYFVFIEGDQSWSQKWHSLSQSPVYLFFFYSIGFLAMVMTRQITRSKKFKAAWFYQITPNNQPALVLYGMIKSIIVKYLLPAAIIITILTLSIWGSGIWLNIVYALINQLFILITIALISARKFPFSEAVSMKQQKGKVFTNILLIFIPLALGYFQSFISGYFNILLILSAVFALITWALFRTYKRMSWHDITGE